MPYLHDMLLGYLCIVGILCGLATLMGPDEHKEWTRIMVAAILGVLAVWSVWEKLIVRL